VKERQLYPDPYGNPSVVSRWQYAHSPYPPYIGGTIPINDTWRTIVTDPEGNDTEYRFYTTEILSWSERPFFYRGGTIGALRYFKGQTTRWLPTAQTLADVDPNFPGTGELVRAVYYRYEAQDPNNGIIDPIHVEGTQTVYYDDRLTAASVPMDPETSGAGGLANYEMEFDLTPETGVPRAVLPEAWATHLVMNDPNIWRFGWSSGTREYATIHKGNLVGGKEIRVHGGDAPCEIDGPFGGERTVFVDGQIVEYSQDSTTCVRRHDVQSTYTIDDRDIVYSRDVGITDTWDNGYMVQLTHTGGDPNSLDPNATGNSGITYVETMTHAGGTLESRKHGGVSWFTVDRDIDIASAQASATRDPAGVQTSHTYDALGRKTLTAPPSPEHSTSVSYLVESGLGGLHKFSRSTETQTGPSGDPGVLFTRQEFDGLGRLVRESRLRDDGGTIRRDTTYDGMGAVTFQSEWYDPNSAPPAPGTTFTYHDGDPAFPPDGRRDPFSRPAEVTDASGAKVKFSYFGLNESRTVTHINKDPSDPDPNPTATTTVYRDYRGNTRIAEAPEGAHALYEYDHAGRLTQAQLVSSFDWATYDDPDPNQSDLKANRFAATPSSGALVQRRTRTIDPLGRLRQTVEPESGKMVYSSYDPQGRLLLSEDAATHQELRAYDPAGRLKELRASQPGFPIGTSPRVRLLRTYAANGRLVRIRTFEDPPWDPIVEREIYYEGLNGRVSEERSRYEFWGDANAPWVSTKYTQDNYGQRKRLTYPIPEDSTRTPTTVEYSYSLVLPRVSDERDVE
jgi:YD repeat-containing protein